MKLKNEKEIEALANQLLKHLAPNCYTGHGLSRFELEDAKSAILFIQQDLLASASDGFEEWFKDHEINGLCGGVLNYEETMFGSRHISTEDIEYNAREAWHACSLSHAKKMQEKDAEIEALKAEVGIYKANERLMQMRIDDLKEANKVLREAVMYALGDMDDSIAIDAQLFINTLAKADEIMGERK